MAVPWYSLTLLFSTLVGLTALGVVYFKEGDIFSPIGFLGLAYLMGWVGPIIDFVLRGDPNGFLQGHDLSYLVYPMVLSSISVVLICIGYISDFGHYVPNALPDIGIKWESKQVPIALLPYLLIGLISMIIFIFTTGGPPTTLAEISQKRFPPTNYILWGTDLLQICALVLVFDLLQRDGKTPLREKSLILIVFFLGMLIPFISSSRSGMLWFGVMSVVLYHYVKNHLNIIHVLPFATVAMILASLMLGLRRTAAYPEHTLSDLKSYILPTEAMGVIFGANRNGVTIVAHIVNKTPRELEPRYGETFLHPVIFPIPRGVWPSKPENIGQYLGETVYDRGIGVPGGGAPPSFVGELYLNFLTPGVLIGSFILGVLMRSFYEILRPEDTHTQALVLIYVAFVVHFVFRLFWGHFTGAIIQGFRWLIPMVLVVAYISYRSR